MKTSRRSADEHLPYKRFVRDRPRKTEIDRASVFRERRLLLALTVILLAIHSQALRIDSEASISSLGFVLSIDHSNYILYTLWAGWLWSLLRYFQYQRTYVSEEQAFLFERRCEELAARLVRDEVLVQVANGEHPLRVGQETHQATDVETGPIVRDGETGRWSVPYYFHYRGGGPYPIRHSQ